MELNATLDRLEKLEKFQPILKEQERQVNKWGVQNHHPHIYNSILVEEVGEVAQAILQTEGEGQKQSWNDVIKELIEVQAVAQSMIESIKRNQLAGVEKYFEKI